MTSLSARTMRGSDIGCRVKGIVLHDQTGVPYEHRRYTLAKELHSRTLLRANVLARCLVDISRSEPLTESFQTALNRQFSLSAL
ncbi:hypothetical protein AcV7_003565 [Taiwanofungus camphoratus]|nr:hypothetical protein AcV7_003565 [Antrodia cinnamomea]